MVENKKLEDINHDTYHQEMVTSAERQRAAGALHKPEMGSFNEDEGRLTERKCIEENRSATKRLFVSQCGVEFHKMKIGFM